jgi:uncharacterized damage-inducible protein DinB
VNPLRALVGRVLRFTTERRARREGLPALANALEAHGGQLAVGFASANGDAARATLRHIVGIERWGQRRLAVFEGQALDPSGHHPHLPAEDASLDELRNAFAETRAATVEQARRLAAEGATDAQRVPHPDLGELSVGGWLAYLDGHARIEARRLR